MERTAGGITYTLTRRRVRNINLRVRADGSVAASASPRVPAAYVDAFVTARADWVRTAQARAAARREREAAEAPALPPKAEALAYMQALCRAYYPQFAATCPGGAMPKIAVRDMNTRWGSCSLRTGTLAFARRLGLADVFLDPSQDDAAAKVRALTEGRGADRVLEIAGGADTFQLAWQIARPNAIVSVIAMYEQDQLLPLPQMYGKNLTFKTGGVDGVWCDEILRLIAQGKIDADPLITHRFSIDDIAEAYRLFEQREDHVMKVAVTF